MIRGILIVLFLGVAGAVLGIVVGEWWAGKMPEAELDALWPPLFGFFAGGVSGLALGIRIAYVLGRREREKG